MKKFAKIILPAILIFSASFVFAQFQNKLVNKVFEGKKLSNGTYLVPDSSINQAAFEKQYKSNQALWDKAITYLTETDLEVLAPGKYAVLPDSSVYAIVTENPTKALDAGKWESHRKYIDLQCVIHGAEQMQKAPLNKVTVTKPYDAATDLANYSGSAALHFAPAGRIFLFFPTDAHRPNIKTDGFDKDKKIVIKILAVN